MVPRGVGNGKADGHEIEKRWIADDHTLLAEIIGYLKPQFVLAQGQGPAGDQVDTAIFSGRRLGDPARLFAGDLVELDSHARGRPAAHGVHYDRAEISRG